MHRLEVRIPEATQGQCQIPLCGLRRGPGSMGVSSFLEDPGQCAGMTFLTFIWLKEEKRSSLCSHGGLRIHEMTGVLPSPEPTVRRAL